VPQGETHFFALFLLAEFGAVDALSAVIEAVSLPGELPFDLFGDAITETLPRILARLAGDRLEVLDALARNPSLNEYVRAAAADALCYLVRDGLLARAEAVDRLRGYLRQAINQRDEAFATQLTCTLASLHPAEAIDDIREAFDLDLVDPQMIDQESVEESISQGEVGMHRDLGYLPPTGVPDAIDELSRWAAFREEPARRSPRYEDELSDAEWLSPSRPAIPWERPEPIRNTRPRVGRNDPCPCGSGKKFKKCCGAR
jgi:hypothetical protein